MNKKRPRLSEDEYEIIKAYRGITNASDGVDLDHHDVKHGWLKSKTASLFFKNPAFVAPKFDPELIDWKSILSGLSLEKITTLTEFKDRPFIFDRLVYTDTHIGMNPNPDGFSLYGGRWDEKELNKRLDKIVETVMCGAKSRVLIIDDLGDLLDGWNGETVRKGHHLPQNMDNQKAFDVALKFKVDLVLKFCAHYEKIIVNNICNDNHAGAFGYVVNSAFKMLSDKIFSNVEVTNHRKFINHYSIGKNVFIICHGKDAENLKFGFTPHLDKKQSEKIDNYIDENYLLQPGVRIEFSKGDSHQLLFDYASSDRFDYFNYAALSPSSNWIQTNYKKGKSGFSFFNYSDVNSHIHEPVFFNWKK
jgi:hypothetical protein